MNKEQRKLCKDKLTGKLDMDISAIEARIANRKIQFDYENAKDEEKYYLWRRRGNIWRE